ncbi:hypothetical protein CUS_5877 [Ruminococcus albus 8]|uniref:Uncharacterized protein n=1 Tax=Ruminococcus albus 8 TaxID=246199 RepID=E9SCG5_RUMAL|nr:hypothetical protein CUS_5877 [Ruminococcus albus 8]
MVHPPSINAAITADKTLYLRKKHSPFHKKFRLTVIIPYFHKKVNPRTAVRR